MNRKAIVLLSGGMDSATVLWYAKKKGYDVECLTFDYGQRHNREVHSAKKIAAQAGCRLTAVKISLPWHGSALLDKHIRIPRRFSAKIPSTYVPARNTIFLSFALSFAEAHNAKTIFIGANAIDFSGYPDCRPKYYTVFNYLSKLATKAGVEHKPITIKTPLIHKTKKEIVEMAQKLGVPLEFTWSCYRGGSKPCGTCDSCRLRARGFQLAGIKDPLV